MDLAGAPERFTPWNHHSHCPPGAPGARGTIWAIFAGLGPLLAVLGYATVPL